MFHPSPPTRRSLTVTVVSRDIATIDNLERYLFRRVWYRAALGLAEASRESLASDCVVLYPDGFSKSEAQRFARRLTFSPTVSLVIIVTAFPARFSLLACTQSASNRLIVLSQPTWPWTLFATIESSLPSPRRKSSRPC
jgi:hypothetical protein